MRLANLKPFGKMWRAYEWVTVIISYDRNYAEKRLTAYALVGTVGQALDSQLEQVRSAGCSSRSISLGR